jgi:predicted RNA binding protein YcfA (HicA-like mRNA interferase family)
MCWRQARVELRKLGAEPIRVVGSHETWRFGDGETFVVVSNHLADDVPVGIVVKLRRLRARRRVPASDEPAPLVRAGPWWFRRARVMRKARSS